MTSHSSSTDKLRRGSLRSRTRAALQGHPGPEDSDEVTVGRLTARQRPARQLESELGNATYNCGCGFVFQAPVLTSVACPHCGDCQAW